MYGTGTSGRATSGRARARRDAFENSSGARSPRAAPTSVANDLLARHPLRLGHRGASPLVDPLAGTDESERRGGRTLIQLRPARSYTTRRDVTPRLKAAATRSGTRSDSGPATTDAPDAGHNINTQAKAA